MGESIAKQIVSVKKKSAVAVFEYVKAHSEVAKVLDEPCSRWKNYKAKMIVSVEEHVKLVGKSGVVILCSVPISFLLREQSKDILFGHGHVIILKDILHYISIDFFNCNLILHGSKFCEFFIDISYCIRFHFE